jgi:CheY-like chemotaxis protein
MDDETRARVFDPFFTTKAVGRGLGLAAVLGIVRGHRGAIAVSSRSGEGTTVRALFPTIAAEFVRPRPAAEASRAQPRLPGGTVLVADDEVIVRSVAKIALEESGFEVLLARDGEQALDLFRERADDIVAVVLDLTMPRMGGDEVLREIRTVTPGLRAILSSGYTEQQALDRLTEWGDTHFIRKPYDPQRLVQMICEG